MIYTAFPQWNIVREWNLRNEHILCQSLFFKKVANPRSATLLKKRLWQRCFPVNFTKFSRTPIFKSISGWLLLKLKDVKLYVTISTNQYLNRVYYERKRLFQVWTSVFTHWAKTILLNCSHYLPKKFLMENFIFYAVPGLLPDS